MKPTLLYNSAAWGLSKSLANELDRFHRKQLRSLIGVTYPNKITNNELYRLSKEEPLSASAERARLRMLGHVLRLPENTPARIAMKGYVDGNQRGHRGRPPTTLANVIQNDALTKHLPGLKTAGQMDRTAALAADRAQWRRRVCL